MTEFVWCIQYLEDIGYTVKDKVVYEDNTSVLKLVQNRSYGRGRTKHVELRYHFVVDKLDVKGIRLEYKATDDMLADILTKPCSGARYQVLVSKHVCVLF